jgi:enamine deaminase RidA (YjgF/YER057c/UK114 family)
MEIALVEHGMTLSNIVRTWLYLDKILDWYGPFNQVRTEIFTQRGVFSKGVPASTGVGATNPYGAAVIASAWAVEPFSSGLQIREVASPLQCAAHSYGSCFSRAMELVTPTHRNLLVSGTASIGQNGRSLRARDLLGQVNLTMEVVKAILNSRNMGLKNATRAVAYFKRIADAPVLTTWCCENNVALSVIVVEADICRDELLFEIELDAMAETEHRQPPPAIIEEPRQRELVAVTA